MKKLIFTLATLVSLSAQAYTPGSKCGLVDAYGDKGMTEVRSITIVSGDQDLSRLQTHQLITAAQLTQARYEEDHEFDLSTIEGAVSFLKDSSSGGDLYLEIIRVEDEIYTAVFGYPGDNQVGFIFKGPKVVAEIGDADISCL